MDCERFDDVSLELLYEELDELSAAATRRHLHHCNRCQSSWNKLKATKELSALPLEEPPADLFEQIMAGEQLAHGELTWGQRLSRTVSILAGYAMRPQLAMAALLLLMIGSSLVFVRTRPEESDKVAVTELGTPFSEQSGKDPTASETLVIDAESAESMAASPAQRTEQGGDSVDGSDHDELEVPRSYAEAMEAYQAGRYAEAERVFAEVAAAGGEKAASAALHEGHSARNGSGCQRAATLYDAVAARHAGSTVAAEASWHAAACYQALGQLERARAHYERLISLPAYAERAKSALATLPRPESGSEKTEAQATRKSFTEGPAAASGDGAEPSEPRQPAPPKPAAAPVDKPASSAAPGDQSAL